MKRWVMIVLAVVCTALTGCERSASEVENTQYVFSGEVIEAEEEYLRIEVNDAGNSSLSNGTVIEVSTDVVAAEGCPEFMAGEYARVLLAYDAEDPALRLEALSVSKVDATGGDPISRTRRRNESRCVLRSI